MSSELAVLLDETSVYVRRFVVLNDAQLVAISLWVAHTYVYETARATPYLHFWSPDPGSGKTTALEVIGILSHDGIVADDLTMAALFRLIDSKRPTLLFDEVDGIFNKKNSDGAEDIRKILNSGYAADKKVWRCVGPKNELQSFNVYCPKALAGLNHLPNTLAHRAIPIAMKPPRHDDVYEDFDPEFVEDDAATLRSGLEAWALEAEQYLRDPRLVPAKLAGLDSRRNQIWRVLFRIADLAGGDWPLDARTVALSLSSGETSDDESSLGVQLLRDIREVFVEEHVAAADLVARLNSLDQSPWGGWSDGSGINSRSLGWKLKPYGIKAKSVRVDDQTPKGYERDQFMDAWDRYLRIPETKEQQATQPAFPSRSEGVSKATQDVDVPLLKTASIPHEQTDVAVVALLDRVIPLPGTDDYLPRLFAAFETDLITEGEWHQAEMLHKLMVRAASAS